MRGKENKEIRAHWSGPLKLDRGGPLDVKFLEAILCCDAEEVRRRSSLAGNVYWTKGENMPLDLFSYTREASRCLSVGCFLGAIALASSVVELILNRDSRTKGTLPLRTRGWATLNNQNLSAALRRGFPVTVLLEAKEDLNAGEPIGFVRRRNRVSHGDVFDIITTISDYDPSAEAEALDQLEKADRFLVEWFNSAPDVQHSIIRNNRWPD